MFYVYIFDAKMGPGFIKICTYFPYPVKVWVNGHEWAKRQALAAGLGFTELTDGFASCQDPALPRRICDRFGPGTVQAWSGRQLARLPLPLTAADRDAGYWRDLPVRQIETSRTLVFDDDVHARAFSGALLRDNMDLGRPAIPPAHGGFKTKTGRYRDLVTVNVSGKNSRLKQYLEDGVALRIETVINDPKDLRRNRQLANRPELRAKARANQHPPAGNRNSRPGHGTGEPGHRADHQARPHPGWQEGARAAVRRPSSAGPGGAIAGMLTAATGITNKTLRGSMTGLLNRPYSMNQASHDLSRLARNELITRQPGRNSRTLTRDGLLFAHSCTKVYDHVPRPLMAPGRPNAPPELAAALATLDHLAARHIAQARLPTAA